MTALIVFILLYRIAFKWVDIWHKEKLEKNKKTNDLYLLMNYSSMLLTLCLVYFSFKTAIFIGLYIVFEALFIDDLETDDENEKPKTFIFHTAKYIMSILFILFL